MKRLLVFVFAVVLFSSCNKERNVHFEFIVVCNADVNWFSCDSDSYYKYNAIMGNRYFGIDPVGGIPGPIPEGSSFQTTTKREDKGENISLMLTAECDSVSSPDRLQCDFEIAIGFFVDGNLQENRSFTNYHNVNQIRFDFTVP